MRSIPLSGCRAGLAMGFHEGYPGVLHGGIVATLLDGAMTNCLFVQGIRALTAELLVRYRGPVLATEELTVRAWQESTRHGLFALRAELTQQGMVKAWAQAKFIRPPVRPDPENPSSSRRSHWDG